MNVSTADGSTFRAELFLPVGEGPHPGVVVLHESFGLNDDMRRIARRFAAAGYGALAPDLYSHGSRIVCLSRVMVDMLRGSPAREICDIRAARDALAARPEVDAERIAVAGFCQGGGFALIAGTQPGFSAAAVNYGEAPADRSRLDGVCPVVASYGGKDRVFGRKMAARLERHLAALGVPHDVKTGRGRLIWPHCGRLMWPHPVRRAVDGSSFGELERKAAERDGITYGAVRADQARPRSGGPLDPGAGGASRCSSTGGQAGVGVAVTAGA